ncbi:fatty acyl-CoA reductase 1-like [Solenopsis invicta]|uniref:fatty acyl-CoA reductase 1-like n=1 Tax=Solenopsis invicta TaxID=13686 RepID=UPI00193EBCC3|nr:fatty acyl-CoA reductase 1-like [Solenopsis invicta]
MTQTNKDYLEDMLDMSDVPNINDCQSEIPQFFARSNILITGGSGFLGILLIEKLLRCCPDIGKMYLFMRTKKDKSPERRLKDQFDDIVYERLKKEQPNFSTKIFSKKYFFPLRCDLAHIENYVFLIFVSTYFNMI